MTEKTDSSWAIELFGDENLGVVPLHPGTILEIEDPLLDLQPPTGSGDVLIRQLEKAAVVSEISGCNPDEAMKIVAQAPPPPTAVATSTDLQDLLNRAIFVKRSASLRNLAIKSMVDALRNTAVFRLIRDDDRFDSLVESLDRYVTVSILTAG